MNKIHVMLSLLAAVCAVGGCAQNSESRLLKDKPESIEGKMLYQSKMDSAESMKGWIMEGQSKTEFKDGWMTMYSPQEDKKHFVYWCFQVFPADFVAEWDAQCLDTELGLCIVFFATKGPQGQDIFDASLPQRDGNFVQYTDGLSCYHISYFANTRETTNMRKNPGKIMVSQAPPAISDTAIHHLRLVKDGGHVTLSVDGKQYIDWTDDGKQFGPVLGEGRIALRQMNWTKFRYRNFKVTALP